MTAQEAIKHCQYLLAHAWMVRTFLKHADEIQSSAEMLDVPRTLYDCIRAVEPAYERGDVGEYLRRLKGKLSKLRKAAHYFRDHFREFSPHTNYEQASLSLLGVVGGLEAVFAAVTEIPAPLPRPKGDVDPLDELEIPDV